MKLCAGAGPSSIYFNRPPLFWLELDPPQESHYLACPRFLFCEFKQFIVTNRNQGPVSVEQINKAQPGREYTTVLLSSIGNFPGLEVCKRVWPTLSESIWKESPFLKPP